MFFKKKKKSIFIVKFWWYWKREEWDKEMFVSVSLYDFIENVINDVINIGGKLK